MNRIVAGMLAFFLLVGVMGGTRAIAAKAEWSDSAYNFGAVGFVLVMDPQFSYGAFDVSGRNKFNKYPYGEEKVRDLLKSHIAGITGRKFVDMDFVLRQIQADASQNEPYDPKSPGFNAMVQREMPKHVQLVLYTEVKDYGWFYEYHNAYMSTRSTTERISYVKKNADGSESSGWMDVPRTIEEHHPAGYYISDSAGVEFRLWDATSNKDVWKYSDIRTRRSSGLSDQYDPSGPESMMRRIFDDAYKKIPLVPQS